MSSLISEIPMKTISVLKATFNQEDIISEAIENIRACSHPGVNFSIRDDCSTDNTAKILNSSELPNIDLVINNSNMGAAENAKLLLAESESDYIAFSAGDDFINPASLFLAHEIINLREVDFIFFKAAKAPIEKALLLTGAVDYLEDQTSKNPIMKNVELFERDWISLKEILEKSAEIPGFIWLQGLVMRRSVALDAGYTPSSTVDDWGLLHNLALLAGKREMKYLFVDRILGVMGVQEGSLGSRTDAQLSSQLDAVHHHWHPRFKKTALLNILQKKINRYREKDYDYDGIRASLKRSLLSN